MLGFLSFIAKNIGIRRSFLGPKHCHNLIFENISLLIVLALGDDWKQAPLLEADCCLELIQDLIVFVLGVGTHVDWLLRKF